MQATLARTAIVAATIMALSGCRSGASSSGWNWGWSRKSATASNPSLNSTTSGPQLPSASATPPGYAPPYSATTQQGAGNGYGDQGAAAGGAYAAGSYAGQSTPYNNSASAAGSIPNSVPPGANYGGLPNAATPNYGAPANNLAPQNGPYNEAYGQCPERSLPGAGRASSGGLGAGNARLSGDGG
jgi:hypothetical protein